MGFGVVMNVRGRLKLLGSMVIHVKLVLRLFIFICVKVPIMVDVRENVNVL